MKMDGRLLGLSIVIFAFAIAEASAQSFYPTRYGKREGRGTEERGSQYERRSDASGNLFFGSRYGKRSYNTTPPESPSEGVTAPAGDRYERSPDTTNADKFFFGSRFGKRNQGKVSPIEGTFRSPFADASDDEYLVCRYTGFRHLYHCLDEIGDGRTGDIVL